MKKIALLFILIIAIASPIVLIAKEIDTSLSFYLIPDTLKKDAHAVLRYDNTELTIKSTYKVSLKRKFAYTILDAEGDKFSSLLEHYNLLVKIQDINGKLIDKNGKVLKVLKSNEIYDRSSYGLSYTFHDDSRIKAYSFNYKDYPYTVEYEIEETIKTTFFIPGWHIQPNYDCAVENSTFTLTYPTNFNVRFKEYLMPPNTKRTSTEIQSNNVHFWAITNIPAYKKQPFSKTGNYISPTLIIAPEHFELLSYKGNMGTWQSLGEFIFSLNKGRDSLPEDKVALVQSLIKEEKDVYSKVQKLYHYMQQNTRYVANEYGISGWQTFDAASVAKNGYGDCKGLTNYLKAMLKVAGIKSYAALIYAGENNYHKLDEDFTSNTFNHVILCVPQLTDTIWIECTNQQLPAGYIGGFTQGRKALLINENGGYICQTPNYGKDKSFIYRTANLTLNEDKNIQIKNIYSGLMQDDLGDFLKSNSQIKISEMINSKFPFTSYHINDFEYKHIGNKFLPVIEETATATVSGITSKTQKRTFINMSWMRNPMIEIDQNDTRTLPFAIHQSFQITDSVTLTLPEGAELESLPNEVNLNFAFATFNISFKNEAGKIRMIRNYEQNEGIYEATEFEKYRKMYQTINASKSTSNIVLLNKQ